MGLRRFLSDWNDLSAQTEFGIVLEYFRRIEVGLRIFFVRREERRGIGLRNFLSKRQKGERELNLK